MMFMVVMDATVPASGSACLRPLERTCSSLGVNPDRRAADAPGLARRYRRFMRAIGRLGGGDPGSAVDVCTGIAGAVLTAAAAWGPPDLIGATIAGPAWLRLLLPVVIGMALMLRRRDPLVMWLAIWAVLALQDLITREPPHGQGLAFMVVLYAAAYALGAHASLRRATAALMVAVLPMAEVTDKGGLLAFDHGGRTGVVLAAFQVLALWLAGVLVRARRRAAVLSARSAALQREAEQAAAAERARIARELHDIVAHHLSVIVLQAAGARASGKPAAPTLEKIENSARQALGETRRLLGVLRDPGEETGLDPQPGAGDLAALAASVRAAGLPVNLVIDGDHAALPAAVDVSVYRIVQEALTNVLRHAGPACADVTIGCAAEAVMIEATDDGAGEPGNPAASGGHGLAGMRERAAVFGGELAAGPRPSGGFAVRARLPLGEALPRDDGLSRDQDQPGENLLAGGLS
jgi:signal transduction histidine kinase